MPLLACDLGALDPAQRARHSALRAELGTLRIDARELADGDAFSYPAEADVILKLAEFMTLERRCCPFFDFELEVGAAGSYARLRIGGGPDVQEFLRGAMA